MQPGLSVAVGPALGFALQNIVVDGETAAKAAMAFLRNERAGRATFLPLDTVKGSHFDASRLSGSARVASSLVDYDPKYNNIVADLLAASSWWTRSRRPAVAIALDYATDHHRRW